MTWTSRMLVAAGAALAGSLALVRADNPRSEARITQAIARPRGRIADVTVSAATDLGSIYGLAGVSGALAVRGEPDVALDVLGAGMTAWAAAQGAKPFVQRPRPYLADGAALLVAAPAGTSWPSGHTAVAAATATSIAPHLSPADRFLAGVTAAFVAFSRIYVGAHYPTDVVAGAGIGMLSALGWRRVRRTLFTPRPDGPGPSLRR